MCVFIFSARNQMQHKLFFYTTRKGNISRLREALAGKLGSPSAANLTSKSAAIYLVPFCLHSLPRAFGGIFLIFLHALPLTFLFHFSFFLCSAAKIKKNTHTQKRTLPWERRVSENLASDCVLTIVSPWKIAARSLVHLKCSFTITGVNICNVLHSRRACSR